MIEVTKKILRKLINNVEKYEVRYYERDLNGPRNVNFYVNNSAYSIRVYPDCYELSWTTSEHGVNVSSIIQDDIYELLDLLSKLKRACEISTVEKFKQFADVGEIVKVDNIDDLD